MDARTRLNVALYVHNFLHVFTILLGTELGSTRISFLRIKNCDICVLIKHVR